MRVLLINFTDIGGGAAMAAVRLVTALNEHGIYARLGVPQKKSACPYVFELPQKKHCFAVKFFRKICIFSKTLFQPITKRLPNPFAFRTSNGILHTTNFHSETDIDWINNSDFDIVNLHWISGVVCNKDIAKIKKPIVWTMHDSWPCCGAEHHPNIAEGDTRWHEGYYAHNKPKTTKGIDLCRKVWKQKKKYLSEKKIFFTAPSRWERDVLKSSALFAHCECTVIPNIIDHSVFYPKDKNAARNLLGIPRDKTVIGFGAAYDIDNPKSMKGGQQLLEMLEKLERKDKYFLVIFGPVSSAFTERIRIPYFASGYIANPVLLSVLYSICDVFINPSHIESMSYTCLEAACCGIPSVAFDVGGISDVVKSEENGILCELYKVDDLLNGIAYCVNNNKQLSEASIRKSIADFNTDKTVEKFISVFKIAIHTWGGVRSRLFFGDKEALRSLFGISPNKTVLGFGAAYDIDNPKSMKGSYYLIDALQKLKNPERYFLVIFGPASDSFTSKVTLPFFASGYVANHAILSCMYSVCDVVVNPSLIENLPNVCLESISCGVPVVAFDVGGTSDIVVHKETGYLATPYKAEELALGIEWCMENKSVLSKNCLEKAVRDFDEKKTVEKMVRVYDSAAREN